MKLKFFEYCKICSGNGYEENIDHRPCWRCDGKKIEVTDEGRELINFLEILGVKGTKNLGDY